MSQSTNTVAKARPILFSGPMIHVLLNGRKTQTRRVVKPSPGRQSEWATVAGLARCPSNYLCDVDGRLGAQFQHPLAGTTQPYGLVPADSPFGWFVCPYGKPGDLLWVREAFSYSHSVNDDPVRRPLAPVWHWADGNPDFGDFAKPRPSIHMPRWASRLTLEITGVRVERLKAISEMDAYAEGIDTEGSAYLAAEHGKLGGASGPAASVCAYADLWDSINGPGAWEANTWVWALSFVVHRRNVDVLLREQAA